MSRTGFVVGLLVMACVSDAQAEVVIETVTVGNPGNAADTRSVTGSHDTPIPGIGSVFYVYRIAKYEVTAGQYTEFLNAVAGVDTYGLYNTNMWSDSLGCKVERFDGSGTVGDPYQYRVAGDWANRPVNYVSWGDAARFCNWMHNGQGSGDTETGSYPLKGAMNDEQLMAITREPGATWVIPSEDEWYKAAYHYNDGVTGNYFNYPTSSDSFPSNDLIDPDPGNNATFDYHGYTIGSPYYRTVFGAHENSDSPYGTFDQGGNVWEWDEAILRDRRGLRGGSAYLGGSGMHARTHTINIPTIEYVYIGFRVASPVFCGADLDCDGDVDLIDFGLFQAQFTAPQ